MKKLLIAASLTLFATAAMAQPPKADNGTGTTAVNGVDSATSGGQGTGAGADMAKKTMPIPGTDSMSTGSMTPDDGMATHATGAGGTAGGNSNATTSVNGVDSATSAGQGTGSGADVAK